MWASSGEMTAPCGVPIVAGIQSAIVGRELNLRTPVIFGDLAERLGGDAVNAIEEGAAHEEGAFRASCGRRYRHCHRRGNAAAQRISPRQVECQCLQQADRPYFFPTMHDK